MNLFTSKEKNIFIQIQHKVKLLTNQSSVLDVQKLVDILAIIFPNGRVLPFNQLYEDAVFANNQNWMPKMKLAVSTFSPESLFGTALIINKDVRINFENQSFSYDQKTTFSQKEIAFSINLKKEGSTITLPLLQNFFLNALLCLVSQRNIQHEFNWQEAFKNDSYYFHLVRHPILHLFRQWLNYMRMNPLIFNRILKVAEVLLIREPIIRLQKVKKSIHITNCHIYGLQMLSQWKLSSLLWELILLLGDSLQQRSRNGIAMLNSWMRLWTSLKLRGSSYEEQLLVNAQNMLENGSPLSMVRFDQTQQFLDAMIIHDESRYTDNLIRQVDSALANDQWIATPQFMQALITFLLFLVKYSSFAVTPDFKAVGSVLIKLGVVFKDEKAHSWAKEALNIYMNVGGQTVAENQYQAQKLYAETGKRSSATKLYLGGVRRSLLSRQDIGEINEWKRPILDGESHILFLLFRWLSCRIDAWRGLPSTEFPTTNLRFLTTPWTFVGLILIMVIIMRLLM